MVRDILSDDGLPYLPELPARGPGADMVGRSRRPARRPARSTCSRWAGGSSTARAATPRAPPSLLARGPRRAGRGLRRLHRRAQAAGRRALDPGLVGVAAPRRAGRSSTRAPPATSSPRWPRACGSTSPRSSGWCRAPRLVLQVDEPGLPAVLAGRLPTASGYGVLPGRRPPGGGGRACATCSPPRTGGVRRPLLRPGPELAPAAGHRRLARSRSTRRCWAPAGGSRPRRRWSPGSRCGPACCPPTAAETSVSGVLGPLVDRWREVGLPVADSRRRHGHADVRAGRAHTRAGPRRSGDGRRHRARPHRDRRELTDR